MNDLLNRSRERPLFVQGTVANQGRFYQSFDAVVLLSAPTSVMLDRLQRRTNNPFGKTREQRLQILADIAEVEPVLREAATHEIDTTMSLTDVVDILAGIAEG